jgi:ferredoxin-NADP reductase
LAAQRRVDLAGLGVPVDASAYVCGPASFISGMREAPTAVGIVPAQIRTELFGAPATDQPRPDRRRSSTAAPAAQPGRERAAGDLCAERDGRAVRPEYAQRA